MGREEIRFEVVEVRNWLGRLRFNTRIVDLTNGNILFASNQRYSRRIDATRAIEKVKHYAAIADVTAGELR